jgi:putative ABC transport system permease protein
MPKWLASDERAGIDIAAVSSRGAVRPLAGGASVPRRTAIAAALGAAGASTRITWVPFAVALLACAVIGVLFGMYPARKAARVDPAASLRGRAA